MDFDFRSIIFKQNRLTILHRYYIHSVVAQYGVYSGQPPLLAYLNEHDSSTQRELAEFLHVSPASVAVSVKRMEKQGMLTREADDSDLRRNRVSITEKGRQICHLCDEEFQKIDRRLFDGFSEEEIRLFSSFLDRMLQNVSDGAPSPEEVRKFFNKMEEKTDD